MNFDFDCSTRAANAVNCPLQLQRFQAPAVPAYLRPNQAQHEREVEIRVIHVTPGSDTDNTAAGTNNLPAQSPQNVAVRSNADQGRPPRLPPPQSSQYASGEGQGQVLINIDPPQGVPSTSMLGQGLPPQRDIPSFFPNTPVISA
ncbi:hypothetical protein PoB_000237700 [Plakobranchus ocellatus]|uniref:Uncharacterized protein n=1 Tax=Plakobranchus ocellatus TaxID=259542 RepID=A0AAV3XZF5_9GAST|nr:hypothetical protein PoB_000237700 [Plakobranchus ocellatus]